MCEICHRLSRQRVKNLTQQVYYNLHMVPNYAVATLVPIPDTELVVLLHQSIALLLPWRTNAGSLT